MDQRLRRLRPLTPGAFRSDAGGATAVEYALLVALLSSVIVLAASSTGQSTAGALTGVASALDDGGSGGTGGSGAPGGPGPEPGDSPPGAGSGSGSPAASAPPNPPKNKKKKKK